MVISICTSSSNHTEVQGKVFTGVFTQYGRRVSRVRVRVSVKIRVRFRFICVGDPTCRHSLAV